MNLDPADHRMRTNHGGRAGDTASRLGAVLAQNDAQSSDRESRRHANQTDEYSSGEGFGPYVLGIGIVILVCAGYWLWRTIG